MAVGGPVDVLGRPLAEWWKRLVAYLIDGLVVGLPSTIVVFGFLGFGISNAEFDPETGDMTAGGGLLTGGFLAGMGFVMLATLAYFTFLNGSERGQTLGKMALKIQVRDETTGGPVGYGRAFIRHLLPAIAGAFCNLLQILDGLWPLWDQKRQALHDKIASTVVVDAAPADTPRPYTY